jgi:hypothetical protein
MTAKSEYSTIQREVDALHKAIYRNEQAIRAEPWFFGRDEDRLNLLNQERHILKIQLDKKNLELDVAAQRVAAERFGTPAVQASTSYQFAGMHNPFVQGAHRPVTKSTVDDRVDELEAKLDKALKALDAAVEKFNQHAKGEQQ